MCRYQQWSLSAAVNRQNAPVQFHLCTFLSLSGSWPFSLWAQKATWAMVTSDVAQSSESKSSVLLHCVFIALSNAILTLIFMHPTHHVNAVCGEEHCSFLHKWACAKWACRSLSTQTQGIIVAEFHITESSMVGHFCGTSLWQCSVTL